MFRVKAGTRIMAVPNLMRRMLRGYVGQAVKVTNKEAVFEAEDILVDPIKPNRAVPADWDLAERGYYGFKLNSKDWDMMLVHMNDIEVM